MFDILLAHNPEYGPDKTFVAFVDLLLVFENVVVIIGRRNTSHSLSARNWVIGKHRLIAKVSTLLIAG